MRRAGFFLECHQWYVTVSKVTSEQLYIAAALLPHFQAEATPARNFLGRHLIESKTIESVMAKLQTNAQIFGHTGETYDEAHMLGSFRGLNQYQVAPVSVGGKRSAPESTDDAAKAPGMDAMKVFEA